jgi:TRAP-type C4-dicarboxylate transport system permease small subunit
MEVQVSSSQSSRLMVVINRLEKYIKTLSKFFNWIAGAGLVAMLVLVVADIIGIKIFSKPIPGGIEVTAFLGVVALGFAIAYTQVLHGHIQVDFLIMYLPARMKAILETLTILFSMILFVLLTWQSYKYGIVLRDSGEVSMTQRIPFYPFVFALAFCYLATFLVLLMDFIRAIMKVGKAWNP